MSNSEELQLKQLENSMMIFQQDFITMITKIQTGMNKLQNNNLELSELYIKSTQEHMDQIDDCQNNLIKFMKECDSLQDNFLEVDILAQKIQIFKQLLEVKLKQNNLVVKV